MSNAVVSMLLLLLLDPLQLLSLFSIPAVDAWGEEEADPVAIGVVGLAIRFLLFHSFPPFTRSLFSVMVNQKRKGKEMVDE